MTSKHGTNVREWGALVALTLLVGVVLACSGAETPLHAEKAEAPLAGESDDAVMAVVGDVSVTRAEVEAEVAGELLRLERERHDLIGSGLEKVVADKLVQVAAQRRGVAADELVQQEVEAKVVLPTDADVDAFYEDKKAQIGAPKEQVADRIREYLGQQRRQQAHADFIARLKEEVGYRSYYEPLRVTVADDGPVHGPATAPVTIVEFSDFQCPFCGSVVPTLEKVQEHYGDKIRLVFRQFPLTNIHPNAQKAAEASLCAHEQNKFWEMHDAMFDDQKGLGVDQLKEKAASIGLDADAFNECLDSDRYAARVAEDQQAGMAAGVSGTPAIFINGRFLSGAQPYEAFSAMIDEELSRGQG